MNHEGGKNLSMSYCSTHLPSRQLFCQTNPVALCLVQFWRRHTFDGVSKRPKNVTMTMVNLITVLFRDQIAPETGLAPPRMMGGARPLLVDPVGFDHRVEVCRNGLV
jgi:hypothetical protein